MRHRFIPQMSLGAIPIPDITFNLSSRHELVPILIAIQYLYVHCKDTLDKILGMIAADISTCENPNRGCVGLSHWENLVMASLRQGCDFDFDNLADSASYHKKVRQIMGLSDWDDKTYRRSTIQDNISKLQPETLQAISELVVSLGHQLCQDPLKRVRGDSFVLKKNVHYPTDSNLICDGIRKLVEISKKIADEFDLSGWRQHDYLKCKAKRTLRKLTSIARRRQPDRDIQMRAAYVDLLEQADRIIQRAVETINAVDAQVKAEIRTISHYWESYLTELHYFIGGTEYACQLARRRVFEDESIPNTDKAFSLFEPDTELINRGKTPYPIEFGHRVLIIQDSAGFIIHSQEMGIGFTDEKIIVDVMKNLQARYNGRIQAASFDKGFWKPTNLKELTKHIPLVVLPKKGRLGEADKERESGEEFKKIRKWHPGVESAIHALGAGSGMKVCRDKGPTGYRRYVAMATLGRNLHTLGKILIEKERKRQKQDSLLEFVIG